MSELLRFKTREAFREWLSENCRRREGVWLEFGKTKEVETLSANDALLEALCFGWIDGVMKKMDDTSYKKYFAPRRAGSKWSQKNKALVQELEACGAMTEYGRRKIEEAKKNGQWDNAASPSAISEEQIAVVAALLKENAQAYTNFQKMPASVKKTYTRAYLDAKTEAGRSRRLAWMMDRLENNLKPM